MKVDKRAANLRKITIANGKKNRNKVINIIAGLFKHDYIKSNGKYNITKIAKDLKMSRTTVYKNIDYYENNKQSYMLPV